MLGSASVESQAFEDLGLLDTGEVPEISPDPLPQIQETRLRVSSALNIPDSKLRDEDHSRYHRPEVLTSKTHIHNANVDGKVKKVQKPTLEQRLKDANANDVQTYLRDTYDLPIGFHGELEYSSKFARLKGFFTHNRRFKQLMATDSKFVACISELRSRNLHVRQTLSIH